jgi:hypothetical protein
MTTNIVQRLIGQVCWYVSAGGVTWPSFVLVCGDLLPRHTPLENQEHPEQFRNNRGSYELLVWCSWRLQTDSAVLATSDEGTASSRLLGALTGAAVTDAICSAPAWDLMLSFSNGMAIQVFCDNHGTDPSASQTWELWVPGFYVCTGPGEGWTENPG